MSFKKTVLIVGLALVGVGGTATYFVAQDSNPVEVKQMEKMPEVEQQAFLDSLLEKASSSEKPSVIEKMLVEKIDGLSKDNASEGVYLLLSSMAVEQGTQMSNYKTVGEGIISAYNDNQFKSGDNDNYGKVEDEAVQGYLKELKRQHLYIEEDGEGLYLSQNLKEIEKRYGEYLNDSIKGIFRIRVMNQEKPYVEANETVYNMNKMMERILLIEGDKDNWKDTIYEGEMLSLQEQVYMDFFAVTHDTYFEDKNGKLIMKADAKENMYALQREYSNSFMGAEIIGYMDELESDRFEKKETQVFPYVQMMERFAIEPSEQAPLNLNQGTSEEGAE